VRVESECSQLRRIECLMCWGNKGCQGDARGTCAYRSDVLHMGAWCGGNDFGHASQSEGETDCPPTDCESLIHLSLFLQVRRSVMSTSPKRKYVGKVDCFYRCGGV